MSDEDLFTCLLAAVQVHIVTEKEISKQMRDPKEKQTNLLSIEY